MIIELNWDCEKAEEDDKNRGSELGKCVVCMCLGEERFFTDKKTLGGCCCTLYLMFGDLKVWNGF